MNETGHNNPPDMTITVGEVANDLSGWMAEHPVIGNEDEAREAKVFIDRASLAIKDLEDERTAKVRPLNDQVKAINDHYRGPRDILNNVLELLKDRFGTFLTTEERRRIALAEEAARVAEQAAQAAREAERKERELIDAATHGELGLDVAATTIEADAAFAAFQKAERQAAVAERDTKVKIGGGFTRAIGLREKVVIVVENPVSAIQDIGLNNEAILEAIISASRAFKKLHGRYPNGVGSYSERKV